MRSRDFVYWLQGYFELGGVDARALDQLQVQCIKNHLAMVFKHDIDPGMGDKAHQEELHRAHSGGADLSKLDLSKLGPMDMKLNC